MKVQIPGHLVIAMDSYITASPDYSGREEFLTDALAGFLAELGAAPAEQMTLPTIAAINPASVPTGLRGVELLDPVLAAAALQIGAVPETVPVVDTVRGLPRAEATWGMHNKDFPMFWAAQHLAVATAAATTPVAFGTWIASLAADAWRVALPLANDHNFDLSGFPTNAQKWAKAEARFTSFFVGRPDGTGPLFDLAIAGLDEDGRCALTTPGVAVLRALQGWEPKVDATLDDRQRGAWLGHLARFAPADVELFRAVVEAVAGGSDQRDPLLLAVAERYQGWTTSQVSTNVAGAIARLREVGLLERRQSAGRYIVSGKKGWALSQLEATQHKNKESA